MAPTVLDPPHRTASGGLSTGSPAEAGRPPRDPERDGTRRTPAPSQQLVATFLMTDMVGSTQMAGDLGDHAWAELLRRHHATVRGQLWRHGGLEVATTGDGFFAVFDDPVTAIVCAAGIVATLRDEGVRARAGVHRGTFVVVEGIPAGVAVHVTARITSRAGAGQVLVSQTVVQAAGAVVAFQEPSLHHLKGVPAPCWLSAVAAVRAPGPGLGEPDRTVAGGRCGGEGW